MSAKGTAANKVAEAKKFFGTNGSWTEDNFKNVKIIVADPKESTNAFTKQTKPNARYWKSGIEFEYKDYKSKVIKMVNVRVPYMGKQNYGSNYIVGELQRIVGEHIVAAALKKDIIVTMDSKDIKYDNDKWWSTVNGVKHDNVGFLTTQGVLEQVELPVLFERSDNKGLIMNLDVYFNIKFSTEDGGDRTSKSKFTISTEISRGYIMDFGVDIEPPATESSIPVQPATKIDVASQELMDKFNKLNVGNTAI